MRALSATVIKGNPSFVQGNPLAEEYYSKISAHLKSLGVTKVTLDEGAPYTRPPLSDVYIGHSRGVDRLQYVRNRRGSSSVSLGDPDGVIHPKDLEWHSAGMKGSPPKEHFMYTEDQRAAVEEAVKSVSSTNPFLEKASAISEVRKDKKHD